MRNGLTKQIVPASTVDFSSGRPRYLDGRPLAPASTRAAVHAEIRATNQLHEAITAGRWRRIHRAVNAVRRFAA